MTTVQNVGANDYTQSIPAQNYMPEEQYSQDIPSDFPVYNPEENDRGSGKLSKASVALGILGLAGVTLGAVKWHSASKYKNLYNAEKASKETVVRDLENKVEDLKIKGRLKRLWPGNSHWWAKLKAKWQNRKSKNA